MARIYLDNSATTRVSEEVFESMRPYFLSEFGNASSIHTFGQEAKAAMEEAREKVASLVGAEPKEIVFTSGGTESDNTALVGIARYHSSRGNHIITSAIEHPAVLKTCKQLEADGFRVTYLPVSSEGLVDVASVGQAIAPETILISIMHANNEIGTIQPIEEIAELARARKIFFHTDAVQTVGKVPVDVKKLGVDLLSISAHKFHAPKGIGALYVRKGTRYLPLLFGGSHERSRRAGTENVALIVGFGRACELAGDNLQVMDRQVRRLRDLLEMTILETISHVTVNGSTAHRLPNISNLNFEFVEGEGLLISLDFLGIAVSTGSACSSGSLEPSHVLTAIGRKSDRAHGSLRFSLSVENSEEQIRTTLAALPAIVERLRSISPAGRLTNASRR